MSTPAGDFVWGDRGAEARERSRMVRAILGGEHDPMAVVWAAMSLELRRAILVAAGYQWLGTGGHWHEVPPQYRAEVKRRCRLLRDTLCRVFPVEDDPPDARGGAAGVS